MSSNLYVDYDMNSEDSIRFKRTILLIILCIISIDISAQFIGGFGCGDPDAWFNKEIYFYCQNQAVNYYGVGLNLQNVSFIIDGETQVDVSGIWQYGDYIILAESDGFKFNKGSVVAVCVNGTCYGIWTCYSSNPTASEIVRRALKNKTKGRLNINAKNVMKVLRKFKK